MTDRVTDLYNDVRGCLNDRDGLTFNGARRSLAELVGLARKADTYRELLRDVLQGLETPALTGGAVWANSPLHDAIGAVLEGDYNKEGAK